MSREIGKQTAPFTMFSSSADGGYLTDLHSNFTGSVEINNLHSDEYGTLVGTPLQGPFTHQWVGGHQHRHQEVLSTTNRGEAFFIKPESSAIKVYGADYPDEHAVRAVLTRDGLAKRALNIANLRTTTGSLSQGNYDHNIQVIQTSGKTQNPRHFAENSETYQQFAERKGFEGNVLNPLSDTGSLRNFALPTGSANKSIITNRFSAPGDRYTMSRGFLNPSGEELSVYSALPYRNEETRLELRERLTRHMSAQGYEVSGSTITTTGSLHKVNRNTLRQLQGGAEGETVTTGSQYDNFYIQHPIPRSDLAYSWITASIDSTAMDSLYGYQKNNTDISLSIPQKDFTNRELYSFTPSTNTTLLPLGDVKYADGDARQVSSSWFSVPTSGFQIGHSVASTITADGLYTVGKRSTDTITVLKTSGDTTTEVYTFNSPVSPISYFGDDSVDILSGSDGIYVLAGGDLADIVASNAGIAGLLKTTDDFSTVTHWDGTATTSTSAPPYLTSSNAAANQQFGNSVSMVSSSQGVFCLIGEPYGDTASTNAGGAYLFRNHGGTLSEIKYFAPPGSSNGQFGTGVSITSGSDGLYCLVGENRSSSDSRAYLYKVSDSSFSTTTTVAELSASDSQVSRFGGSASVVSASHGAYSLVGLGGSSAAEKAYLFRTYAGTTSEIAEITASVNNAGIDNFATSVSITARENGEVFSLIGSYYEDTDLALSGGMSFLFKTVGNTTSEVLKMESNTSVANDEDFYGFVVDLVSDESSKKLYATVGEYQDDSTGVSNDGAINFHVISYKQEFTEPTLTPYSSWAAIRRNDNTPIRYFRDNNLLSFWNAASDKTYASTTVVSQSAVTTRNKPVQHVGLISGDSSGIQKTFKSSYTNQNNLFSKQKTVNVENRLGISERDDTFYSSIKGYYIGDNPETTNSPFSVVSRVRVSDTIYPIEKATYSVGARSRPNYTEESGTGTNGYDRQYGKQNTFFHSTKTRSNEAENSFGFTAAQVISPASEDFSFGSDLVLPSNLSTQYARLQYDSTAGNASLVFGQSWEPANTERYVQPTFEVSGATSVSFDFVKGTYSPLSLDRSEAGEDLLIEYQNQFETTWNQSYVNDGTNPIQAAVISSSVGSSIGEGSYSTLKNYFENVGPTLSFSSQLIPLVKSDGSVFSAGTKVRIVNKSHSGGFYDNYAIRNLSIDYNAFSLPPEHKAFFPLQSSGLKSFPLSSSYEGKNGELLVDKDESAYTSNPTPSQCYVESTSLVKDGILSDYLERTTNTIAGINPWEDSYDDFREDFRGLAKDMSVLPEFKISDHLDIYFEDGDFTKIPANYLKIRGGDIAEGEINDYTDDQFIDKHITSEPLGKYKNFLKEHQDTNFDVDTLSIKVDAVKKLLPYNGFYPMTRTVQLGNLLSASFIENITGKQGTTTGYDTQGFQAISKTLMSPGILYNSIKAGYGVSYPVYKTSPTTVIDESSSYKNVYEGFHIESAPDYQIPFEALINPKGNIPSTTESGEDEDIIFTPSWTSTTPAAPSYDYSGQWDGTSKPQFQLGMHNFLAETVKFFIEGEKLRTFVSQPESSDSSFTTEAGKTYYMDVLLRDNLKMDRAGTYSGNLSSSADAFLNIGTTQWDVLSGSDAFYMATRESNPFETQIQTGYSPKISLYRKTYDAEPWKLLDSFTIEQQGSEYNDAPIKLVSGSSHIFVAVKTHNNNSDDIADEKVRVYRYSSNSFDTVSYDEIGADNILSPATVDHFATDFKLEPALHGGYYLLSNYYTNAGFSYNITSSDGFGAGTTSVSIPSQTRCLVLHESSSAEGVILRNVFHNISPNASTHSTAKKGFADNGTFDMVSASYTDDVTGFRSSSMGGLIITCGYYGDSGSINSTATNFVGSVNLYYSSSYHGTASANVQNPNEVSPGTTRAKDFFGIRTSVTNNRTGPNRNFYFAASTLKNTTYTGYDYGSVQVFSGSIQSGSSDGLRFNTVGRMETFNKTYIDDSGLDASAENSEFHTNGGINSYPSVASEIDRAVSLGSDIDLISSNFSDGIENKLYLAVSNPSAEYKQESTAVTGSLMLLTLSGGADQSGVDSGNFTFLPTYLLTNMTSSYTYANNHPYYVYLQTAYPTLKKTAFIKLISSSAHPYNPGDELSLFSGESAQSYNRNGSSWKTVGGYSNDANASFDDTHIVMHTGSAYLGAGFGTTYSNLDTRVAKPNFSASVQIASDFVYRKDGSLYGQGVGSAYDPAYAAYTPPSYYGTSIARISYTAPTYGGKVTLDDIFNNASVNEIINLNNDRVAKFYSNSETMSTLQKQARMPVSSSVNLFGRFIPKNSDGIKDETNEQWVISTRFESPVLDFSTNDTAHSNAYSSQHDDMLASFNFDSDSAHLPPRSMWTSYGTIPSNEKGITMELAESYDPAIYSTSTSGSLIQLCGFTESTVPRKLGKVAQEKEVSEAVVLIPYVKSPGGFQVTHIDSSGNSITTDGKWSTNSALKQNNHTGTQQEKNKVIQFKSRNSFIPVPNFLAELRDYDNPESEKRENSVTRMIEGMEKYILPPHLDFLERSRARVRNNGIGAYNVPFAMYFVEIDHTLNQQDLSDIWQGVMPEIARNFEAVQEEVSHPIDNDNFFCTSDKLYEAIQGDLSFLVFKVKRRAETNYFNVTRDSTDDVNFSFKFGNDEGVVPEYSYNWPYDFFSLVETAKVTVGLNLKNTKAQEQLELISGENQATEIIPDPKSGDLPRVSEREARRQERRTLRQRGRTGDADQTNRRNR